VAPPSEQELERRLRNRGTETEEKVLQRLANATSEIAKAQVCTTYVWHSLVHRVATCVRVLGTERIAGYSKCQDTPKAEIMQQNAVLTFLVGQMDLQGRP
jgi:guanylate kinase